MAFKTASSGSPEMILQAYEHARAEGRAAQGMAPVAGPPTAATDMFAGEWVAEDPIDASSKVLDIQPTESEYDVALVDQAASSCGDNPVVGAEIKGAGTVLTAIVTSLTCLNDPPITRTVNLQMVLTYDPETQTLLGSLQDATWSRNN